MFDDEEICDLEIGELLVGVLLGAAVWLLIGVVVFGLVAG